MGLFAARLSSLPEGQPCGETRHPGRVLRQLQLSPQACHPLAEPSAAGGETGAPAPSTRPNLRLAHDGGSEVRLGSGRLSLVGTPEGLVAGVDALDSPPLPADVGRRSGNCSASARAASIIACAGRSGSGGAGSTAAPSRGAC